MCFEELTKRLRPKLKAIAKSLNNRYSAFDDEDLYQEAVIHLWGKCSSGEFDDKTNSFILQGCYFFLKNHIRKIYKKIDHNSLSLNNALNDEGSSFENILSCPKNGQRLDDIESSLLAENIYKFLTHREREIFSLSLKDLSTREIGKKLRISHVMVIKIRKGIRNKCQPLMEEIIKGYQRG